VRGLRLDVFESRKERVHRRKRRRNEHPDVFALRPQRLREGKAAAEGVTIGVLMTEDQDLLVRVDEVFDLVIQVARLTFGLGYEDSSLSSPP
jgi:hypothetical protein